MKCLLMPCPSRALQFSAWPVLRNNKPVVVKRVPEADELVLHSTLAAPVETVFRYWTTAAHLARWWSPCPVATAGFKLNAQAGGDYRLGIRTHDGDQHWLRGRYREVVAPRRLVFTWSWEAADDAAPASLVNVTFEALGESTRLLLRHAGFASPRARAAHQAGWVECFERLQGLLASDNLPFEEVSSC